MKLQSKTSNMKITAIMFVYFKSCDPIRELNHYCMRKHQNVVFTLKHQEVLLISVSLPQDVAIIWKN